MSTQTLVSATTETANTHTIDPSHSSAQFSIRHMMISNVKGEFSVVRGSLAYDAGNPAASKIDVVIEVNSINTREPARDAHLKSADFFHAEQHPTITFQSRKVKDAGEELHITGDLTIRGVTREVELTVERPTPEVKDPWGNPRIGASATTKLNRKDWGLVWNQVLETGGMMVGNEVKITIDIEATRDGKQGELG